jgi:hypothetical protein
MDIEEKRHQFEEAAAELDRVLGDKPVEFATAGDLVALLSRIPADTLVRVAWCLREAEQTHENVDNDRLTAAAYVAEEEGVQLVAQADGRLTSFTWPVAAVRLGAFYVPQDQPVPAATVPLSPYERAIEAMHTADDEALFAACREMINEVADALDGNGDASFYESLTDPAFIERAETEAQLLREAAARIGALYSRIKRHSVEFTG